MRPQRTEGCGGVESADSYPVSRVLSRKSEWKYADKVVI